MISSRNISDLHPVVAKMCQAFIDKCAAQGIHIIITSTYRDNEMQQRIYNQGRTTPGNIITNAKPGDSFHNYRLAFDFAPLKSGKIDWNDTEAFTRCGEIGESVGLEWAGRWKSFKELAHLQYTGGLTIAKLKTGVTLA